MKVVVAQNAGFCFGVRRAVERAEDAVTGAACSSLGPLIHNPQEVERLRGLGLHPVEEAEIAEGETVVTRSHGTPVDQLARLEARGPVVDTTCPSVKVCHRRAEKMAAEGYVVLIVGDPGHPEAESIASFARRGGAPAPPVVIADAEQLASDLGVAPQQAAAVEEGGGAGRGVPSRRRPITSKAAVVAQTTAREQQLAHVVAACLPRFSELRVFNTICDASVRRQREALELARSSDLVIVVGGRRSANTRRLVQTCAEVRQTRWIEAAEELESGWFEGCQQVAVTAGASTPDRVIAAVVRRLEVLGGSVQDGG